MKILVVGLGSMGKRRIGILRDICPDAQIIGVDSLPQRREEAAEKFGISCCANLDDALNMDAQCAVICTSPLSHSGIINTCLKSGLHVFTELNLVSDLYAENIRLAKEKGVVLFLSSTFLYRNEPKYIIDKVKKAESPLNYIYHVGQYLPDWHPWENYKDYFVGDKRTNGCREIFSIELPWLVSCFGKITDFAVNKSKNTQLLIDYADNYMLQLTHESGAKGLLAVDVVSRKAVRKFELFGEDIYLSWGGTPDSLVDYDIEAKRDVKISFEEKARKDGYATFIAESPYYEELSSFLAQVENPSACSRWDFERDLEILSLIDKIEE